MLNYWVMILWALLPSMFLLLGLLKRPFADRSIDLALQVPQQKNDYDCGLFVLYFMERFIEEAPPRIKKKDLAMVLLIPSIELFYFNLIVNLRDLWFYLSWVLFVCTVIQFRKQWFRPEEASSLRAKIHNLLIKELKKVVGDPDTPDSSPRSESDPSECVEKID